MSETLKDKKICVITSTNEAVTQREVDKALKSWGVRRQDLIDSDVYQPPKTKGLFGNPQAYLVRVNDKETRDRILQAIKDNDLYQYGLIIHVTDKRTKVFKELKKLNAKIMEGETVDEALEPFPLRFSVKDFISNYVGETPEKVMPIVDELKSMSEEEIKALREEDVIALLPLEPGEVPIYTFMDPLLQGDVKKALFESERILKNAHPLVLTYVLNKRVRQLFWAHLLIFVDGKSYKEAAKIIKVHPYVLKVSENIIRSRKKTMTLVKLMYEMEKDMKMGGSPDPEIKIRKHLIKIGTALRS